MIFRVTEPMFWLEQKRWSRLYTYLQGNWGAMSAVAWATRRDANAKFMFPCHEFCKTGVSDGFPTSLELPSAQLAASWGSSIFLFQVPAAAVR